MPIGTSTLSFCLSWTLPLSVLDLLGDERLAPFLNVSQNNLVRLAAPVTPASPPRMLRVKSIPHLQNKTQTSLFILELPSLKFVRERQR